MFAIQWAFMGDNIDTTLSQYRVQSLRRLQKVAMAGTSTARLSCAILGYEVRWCSLSTLHVGKLDMSPYTPVLRWRV
jgi:hypothetical protein